MYWPNTRCKAPLLPPSPPATRLPPLEVAVDASILTKIDGTLPEELMPLFQGEMRQNIAELADTATFGYARLVVVRAKVKRIGRALQIFQMAILLITNVLGIPLKTYQTNLTAEVGITDAQGEVLGRYEGQGQSKVRVAM